MSIIETLYGPVTSNLIYKLSKIKLLVCDVDGVFSDGKIYLGNDGEELKTFHTLDGYGVKAIRSAGIEVAVITGRQSAIVENRMSSLGITLIIQGEEDKEAAIKRLKSHFKLKKEHVASIGDDMPDVTMFGESSLGISVPNGHPYVRNKAEYVTRTAGGSGAVREVCDLLLFSINKLNQVHGGSST